MPRFFFHVHDGTDMPDHTGTVLPGVAEAQAHALTTITDLLKSRQSFWQGHEWFLDIEDESHVILYTVRFVADPKS